MTGRQVSPISGASHPPTTKAQAGEPMRIEQLEYLAAVTRARVAASRERAPAHLPAGPQRGADQAREGARRHAARPPALRLPDQPAAAELLQNMTEVLEAVDRLREAAGDQAAPARAAHRDRQHRPSTLLVPALRDLHARHGSAASRCSTPSRRDPPWTRRGYPRPGPGQRPARRRRADRARAASCSTASRSACCARPPARGRRPR